MPCRPFLSGNLKSQQLSHHVLMEISFRSLLHLSLPATLNLQPTSLTQILPRIIIHSSLAQILGGGVQDFIARVYNFAVAPNPRLVPVHKKIDSLMNTTPLPLIQDCVVDVDENLVTAAQSDGLLISFLDTYW